MIPFEDFLKEAELRLDTCRKMAPDGSMPLNDDYQEILKLHEMLEEHEIPHVFDRIFDGWFVHYPVSGLDEENHVCSCVQHFGSYGAFRDCLELMGLTTEEEDNPQGWLTAEDVFCRIEAHWRANRENA